MKASSWAWPSFALVSVGIADVSEAAQTQPAPAAPADPLTPGSMTDRDTGDIVVTGHRTAGTAIETVKPLAVFDSAALLALGPTSMADLMKRLKGVATSANGGEPAILLNGRRVSGFGDLMSLSPESIERVEVLPEQEAARFGFPPTMRVMNFITKKHFRSVTLQELGGTTTEGGGATNYVEVNGARIEGPKRASLSLYYLHLDPLLQSQRAIAPDPDSLFAVGGNVTGVGGGSIDPSLDRLAGHPVTIAAVPQSVAARQSLDNYVNSGRAMTDSGAYRTLQQRTDTLHAEGAFGAPLGKSVDGSLNLSVQADRNSGLSGLASGIIQVPGGTTALPFSGPVLVYRAFPGAVLHQNSSMLTAHGGLTLQGSIRRWSWNVTTSYDRVFSRADSETGVPLDALQDAVTGGGDPMAALDVASAAQRTVNHSRTSTSTVASKAVVNGSLAHLPAGDAQVTVSADYSRSVSGTHGNGEAIDLGAVSRSIGGASFNTVIPIASAQNGVLPILGQLTVNGMVGVSDVSRYGRLTSSNYGFTWTPVRPVQLTGSITETRTPPAIGLLVSPTFTTPNTPFFDFTAGASVLVSTLVGGNPSLMPERRRTTTLGLALQPFKDREFRFGIDFLDTTIDNQSATLGSLTPDFQVAFSGLFLRDLAGTLISVDLRPVNLARENEKKLRMTLNLQTPIGRAPPPPPAPNKDGPPAKPAKPRPFLYINLTTNYRLQDRLVLRNGLPSLDLLNGATIDGTSGRPEWDVDGTVGGNYGPFNVGVYARLQAPTRIRSASAVSDLRFSAKTWLTLYGSLDIAKIAHRPWSKQMSLQFTVENMLNDRIQVRDRTGATPNRFQAAYLDPLGLSVRLGLRKLF